MRSAGYVARMGEMTNVHKTLIGKPERKRSPRRRWEDNIRMDLRETSGMDWIHLAQDRNQWRAVVYMVMKTWFL
jgi:hypothetical protein